MITSVYENILDSKADCLVNTVNCDGYMGKGIAFQFKQKYPENEKYYRAKCKDGEVKVGKILFFQEADKYIANFPTKDSWREKSQYAFIETGLDDLKANLPKLGVHSIAIPPLGCGNGGLEWNRVKQMIIFKLDSLPFEIYLHEPSRVYSAHKAVMPKINASHILLMRLKLRLRKFNKLRLQKACFFVNLFSGNEYFRFEDYKYGPYSHAVTVISNQIRDLQSIYNVATAEAEKIALNNLISENVLSTINTYETALENASLFVNLIPDDHTLEVISTILCLIKKYPNSTVDELIRLFFEWPKDDKSRFSSEEIISSISTLEEQGIINKELVGYSLCDDVSDQNKMKTRLLSVPTSSASGVVSL